MKKIIIRTAKKSLYTKHLIEQQHTLHTMETCMTTLHFQQKSRKLNTTEQFHNYEATKTGKQLNEQYTEKHNTIFETVLKIHPPTYPQTTTSPSPTKP
jgi:hypothetical protein